MMARSNLFLILIVLVTLPSGANAESSGFIWQGFNHEWRRFVILPLEGRIPHRISKFASFIKREETQGTSLEGTMTFAQSTGVDGNYMRPRGFFTAIESEHLQLQEASHQFIWTDATTGEDVPVAESTLHKTIHIAMPEDHDKAIALLSGIDLEVDCDNDKQPDSLLCNSNGLWPYKFYVGFKDCFMESQYTPHQQSFLNCDLTITLNRGWTPNRGGLQLPPFFNEIKPLNHRLDISLTAHYVVISGHSNDLTYETVPALKATQPLQDQTPVRGQYTHYPEINNDFSTFASGITGFGFELKAAQSIQPFWQMLGSDTRQQGRYIAKMAFNVANPVPDINRQSVTIDYNMHVWSPITVVDSMVTTQLETALLAFNRSTQTTSQQQATGRLCINSTEQAPEFSKWHHCDLNYWWARWLYGSPQSSDTLSINAF